ncbi:MAG: exo-beta-N-acetylmuramidase NamZ family protein [Chthoniobacteraceae bacterium]
MRVRLAIDDLESNWPAHLRGCRLGAVLHPASVNSRLEHTSRVLERHSGTLFQLRALFGPQHGYLGQTQDNMIEWRGYEHPRLGIPVYSLYGEHREPTPEMVAGLDALLVDLQDIGARYYTFIWTLYLCMRACEAAGVTVIVHDRPNPLNGIAEEGPLLDPAFASFVGLHPLRIRHGKTIGELARLFQQEAFPDCRLEILPMRGWEREMWFNDTGLPWVMPSPNMPTLDTAIVYPGMCLLEATNLSEGRGTTRPFELFGAAWIDAEHLAQTLNQLALPGVFFREAYFQPTFHKFAGELCGGVQIHVTDRDTYLPFRTAMEILRHVLERYAANFEWKPPPYEYELERLPIEILLGGPLADFFH